MSAQAECVEDGIEIMRVGSWERFEWLRHGFSTRMGGVSTVYGGRSLNLGWTKEDDEGAVRENRRSFLQALGSGEQLAMVGLRQIHSDVVRGVRETDGALEGRLESAEGRALLEGDGLITDVPGVLVAVGTADCVPVLVVDGRKRAVGAFHAGWRGTVARIVEQGVSKMVKEYGSQVEDLVAAVGPSIGSCCYSVGEEVFEEFGRRFGYGEELFRVSGEGDARKIYLDLWEANRRQLVDAGLIEERISVVRECTSCRLDSEGKRRYFSHRADIGVAGRMLSGVGIVGQPRH